jgi:hypothetical protein
VSGPPVLAFAGAAIPSARREGRIPILLLGAFWASLAVIYLPAPLVDWSVGIILLTAVLFLHLLLAPLEFALGAFAFSFLAAASVRLGPQFLTWRWLFLGAAAVIFLLRFFLRRRTGSRPALGRFDYLLAAFLVAAAGTVLTSVSPRLSALKLAALLCLFYVAAQGASRLVELWGPAAPHRLVIGLLALAGPMVALPIVGWLFSAGQPTVRFGWFAGYHSNPNTWAMLVAAVFPWIVCPLLRRRRRWGASQWALLAIVLLAGYTLLSSGSRAGILAGAAALTIICAIHANRRIAALAAAATVLFVAKSVADPEFVPGLVKRYVFKHPRSGADLLQSRKEPWKIVREQFERHRWMGLGFGVSSELQSGWQTDVSSGSRAIETGSSFWGTLSQVGIVGAPLAFLAILSLLAQGARFCYAAQDPWLTAVYASVAGLAVNSLFEGWLIAPGSHASTFFWVQCFCLNAVMRRYRAVSRPARRLAAAPSAAPSWVGASP